MDRFQRESFWHNFRLMRSRMKGLSAFERAYNYAVIRAGIWGPIFTNIAALASGDLGRVQRGEG